MIIIGIDPSLSCTSVVGGSIREMGEIYASNTFGSKPTKGEINAVARYEGLAYATSRWIADTFSGPYAVYVEGYSYGSPFNREILGEYRSILYQSLRDICDVKDLAGVIATTSLKKFVAGKGNADKKEMAQGVLKNWGAKFRTHDEVDAYGLFRIGLCLQGLAVPSCETQSDALDSIVKPAKKAPRKRRQSV